MKSVMLIQTTLVAIGFSCFAFSVLAQAPVSDVSTSRQRVEVTEGYGAGVDNTSSTAGGSESGNLFRQVQQLQQEVSTLRGQLEEQSYELQKLKQQHQDDFANLDRRLSGGAASSDSSARENTAATAPIDATAPLNSTGSTPVGNDDGREEYEAAYTLLKTKDYNGAASAFEAFVGKYPQSDYAGNSWFWLGFVHQTQGDMDAAGNAFSSLIERFPNHAKVDDAKYNLGKIYNQQGKAEQARKLLKEVAAGSSKSAPLAKSYLESM